MLNKLRPDDLLLINWLPINPLSANPTKWSNTLKQFVGNFPTNCLTISWNWRLTLSLRRPLSYRNLSSKSMDWVLYDNGLRHERIKGLKKEVYVVCKYSNEHQESFNPFLPNVPFWPPTPSPRKTSRNQT